LMAMCRAAGLARVELLHASGLHAGVACTGHGSPSLFKRTRHRPNC
jgi:hypothetical protein